MNDDIKKKVHDVFSEPPAAPQDAPRNAKKTMIGMGIPQRKPADDPNLAAKMEQLTRDLESLKMDVEKSVSMAVPRTVAFLDAPTESDLEEYAPEDITGSVDISDERPPQTPRTETAEMGTGQRGTVAVSDQRPPKAPRTGAAGAGHGGGATAEGTPAPDIRPPATQPTSSSSPRSQRAPADAPHTDSPPPAPGREPAPRAEDGRTPPADPQQAPEESAPGDGGDDDDADTLMTEVTAARRAQWRAQMEAAESGTTPTHADPSPATRPTEAGKRRRILPVAAVLVLAAAAGGSWWAWTTNRIPPALRTWLNGPTSSPPPDAPAGAAAPSSHAAPASPAPRQPVIASGRPPATTASVARDTGVGATATPVRDTAPGASPSPEALAATGPSRADTAAQPQDAPDTPSTAPPEDARPQTNGPVIAFPGRFKKGSAVYWFTDDAEKERFVEAVRNAAATHTVLVEGCITAAELEAEQTALVRSRAWAIERFLQKQGLDPAAVEAAFCNPAEAPAADLTAVVRVYSAP